MPDTTGIVSLFDKYLPTLGITTVVELSGVWAPLTRGLKRYLQDHGRLL